MKFWLLQTLGWLPFFLLHLLFRAEDGRALSAGALLYALSLSLLALAASLGLRKLYRAVSRRARGALAWLGMVFAASLGLALLVDGLHHLGLTLLGGLGPTWQALAEEQPLFGRAPLLLPAFLAWSLLYLALSRQEHFLRAQAEQQNLRLALQEAQLQGLLAQLNPHFMFNTLNNIRALILKDSEAARTMLGRFAEMLRYQLEAPGEALASVAAEMDVVRDYLSLVGLQLGKRLNYSETVAPDTLGWRIPRLSLQLLVENAVKHGLSRQPGPGVLELRIAGDAGRLAIAVRNSGRLSSEETPGESTGIGLNNLRRRLALAFGPAAVFSLGQDGDGVLARIDIRKPA